jgi:hypothetical protein
MTKEKPPLPSDRLGRAHYEITELAKWARQVGMNNVAPRLVWTARLIQEEMNSRDSPQGEKRGRDDIALKIIGLADRGEITLDAIERLLQ